MLIEEILNSEEIKKIEEIEKGWSADNKFYIQYSMVKNIC